MSRFKPEMHKTELDILHKQLEEARQTRAAQEEKVTTLHDNLDVLHKKVEEHKVTVTRYTEKMDEARRLIATRNTEVKKLTEQLDRTKNELAASTTEIKTLRSRLASLDKETITRKVLPPKLEEEAATTTRSLLERTENGGVQKERDAFRDIALRLYASKVDQEAGLAERHAAMTGVAQLLEARAEETKALGRAVQAELGSPRKLHGETGAVLDELEGRMKASGLAEGWARLESEAMDLE